MFDYTPPENLLRDRIIAITGAGDGIGRAAALSCAQYGATVILIGRTTSKLEAVYDNIEQAGGPQPAIFPLDFLQASEQDYENLARATQEEFGKLHGLLHNAAVLGGISPIQAVSMKTWQDVMQVNVNAAFALTRYMMPLMLNEDDASIVFTSSSVGREARAFWGPYAVSKAADEMLMQVLQLELENTSNVRVNSVNPGATATAMRRQAFPAEDPGTLPSAEDIMPVYLYLMGPDSRDVKGQQLNAR